MLCESCYWKIWRVRQSQKSIKMCVLEKERLSNIDYQFAGKLLSDEIQLKSTGRWQFFSSFLRLGKVLIVFLAFFNLKCRKRKSSLKLMSWKTLKFSENFCPWNSFSLFFFRRLKVWLKKIGSKLVSKSEKERIV